MNVKEVAALCGRSENAIRSAVEDGYLPSTRRDGRIYITKRDAERYDKRLHARPHGTLSAREAAQQIGMSAASISRAIKLKQLKATPIIRGRKTEWIVYPDDLARFAVDPRRRPNMVHWDDSMDAALLELIGSCSYEQVATYLNVSTDCVHSRLKRLKTHGRYDGVIQHGTKARTAPFVIPSRAMLLAKSCTKCGVLRDASMYRFNGKSTATHCRLCHNEATRDYDRSRENEELLQEVTYNLAANRGQPYTSADLELIGDLTLSEFEVAIKLQRTYYGIRNARRKRGLVEPKPRRHGSGEWVVHFPNALKALQTEFARLGGPVPEEVWDWNDEVAS